MKEIEFDELKALQLEMLNKLHLFCCENNIRYSLDFGTLLGAIRHQGYIPWDDDIDIVMPRPDYDKFIHLFNGKIDNLVVYAPELDWSYYATYANVCDLRTVLVEKSCNHRGKSIGVKIDIFPLDGVPTNYDDYLIHTKHLKSILRCIAYKKWTRASFMKTWRKSKLGLWVAVYNRLKYSWISYNTLQERIHKLAVSYPYESADYVEKITFNSTNKSWRIERGCFENYIEVPFEDFSFCVVKDYHKYLTILYGDYMQLPPEEQRIPHHGFTAYWK